MKTRKGKTVFLFDNGGETADRYTILTATGDIAGCSIDPYHPMGIGCFSHNLMDSVVRNGENIKKTVYNRLLKSEIRKYRDSNRMAPKGEGIGKELKTKKEYDALPEAVKNYIDYVASED